MKWLSESLAEFGTLFEEKPIVLCDIGSAGGPPKSWEPIAPISVYFGFDPDNRDAHSTNPHKFRDYINIDKFVTQEDKDNLDFFLTKSPHCSSALKPNSDILQEYAFADLFTVQQVTSVPAAPLGRIVEDYNIGYIDCMKLDTQGLDLEIIKSIPSDVFHSLIELNIEPGLDEFYLGENQFTQAHTHLINNGFWLSDARFQKSPRIAAANFAKAGIDEYVAMRLPGSPTAVEAMYFRTRSHLADVGSERGYVCAWILAMLAQKYGFAIDIAVLIAEKCGQKETSDFLMKITCAELAAWRGIPKFFRPYFKQGVPTVFHPFSKLSSALSSRKRNRR